MLKVLQKVVARNQLDIDKILFQLKRNGEFKNVGDANKFSWGKNNKK